MKTRRSANSPPPLPPERVREQLLRDVEHAWIEGVLQHSPYQDLLHALHLASLPDALAHPWHFQLQAAHTPPTLLPADTSIREIYEQSGSSLLLLGQPGAGKTTVLLTLGRDLLARARLDGQQPVPVIFNLSTWTTQQRTLDGWLFDELAARYHIERHHARAWLRADLLVLLLDGLDELAPEARTSCIEAINVYYQEHPSVQLVVCSCEDEYLDQVARLDLRCTAQLQPLSKQQVEQYFAVMPELYKNVCHAWQSDAGLQALMQIPLLLTIILLTYPDTESSRILPIAMQPQEQREQIFATYAEQVLRGSGGDADVPSYTDEQVQRWLSWIARQMQGRNQSIFYLENMQPDWLPTVALRRSFAILFGLIAGLPYILPISLLIGGINGVAYGLGAGLIVSWLVGSFVALRSEIRPVDTIISVLRALSKNILIWLLGALLVSVPGFSVGGVLYGACIMLLYGLLVWVVVGPTDERASGGRQGGTKSRLAFLRSNPNGGRRSRKILTVLWEDTAKATSGYGVPGRMGWRLDCLQRLASGCLACPLLRSMLG